jgi:hypothetical protein
MQAVRTCGKIQQGKKEPIVQNYMIMPSNNHEIKKKKDEIPSQPWHHAIIYLR